MNIAIIREEMDTHRNSFDSHLEKEVREHTPLFPCSFHHAGESSLELNEGYESALDIVISFLEMLLAWDPNGLASFLMERYEGLDQTYVTEKLALLGDYYEADSYARKIHEGVIEARKKAQP